MCASPSYSEIKCREPRCGTCVRISLCVRSKPRKRSRSLKPSDKERRNRSWRLSYEHLAATAIASLEYRKILVNFWPTFVQSGYLLLILDQHIIKRLSLDFFGPAPVLIAKRNLRQRVLRLSIEVRVHRKQLFRRDRRQVPSFDHASLFCTSIVGSCSANHTKRATIQCSIGLFFYKNFSAALFKKTMHKV